MKNSPKKVGTYGSGVAGGADSDEEKELIEILST